MSSYKYISGTAWSVRPMTKAEKDKSSSNLRYADNFLVYERLKASDFNIIVDNEVIETKCDVEVRVEWEKGSKFYSKVFTIKKGFTFDGASIPPMFWDLIGEPDDVRFLSAALVHDYLYGKRFNREISDWVFRNFLEKECVWSLKATLMWAAVRIGGFTFYAGDTSKFWAKIRNFLK